MGTAQSQKTSTPQRSAATKKPKKSEFERRAALLNAAVAGLNKAALSKKVKGS
jgi:hypothetical protein